MGLIRRLWGRSSRQDKELASAERGATTVSQKPADVDSTAISELPMISTSEPTREAVPRPSSNHAGLSDRESHERSAPSVKRVVLPKDGLSILDLTGIKSTRTRIVGLSYWVPDSGRAKHGGTEYLLLREPKNEWDVNAVAVYGKGRKVGHLSAAKAAALAPIFDALDYDAFKVGGASVSQNSSSLWVDLPALPALRAFVKSAELQQDAAGSGVPADK